MKKNLLIAFMLVSGLQLYSQCWDRIFSGANNHYSGAVKDDGTLWMWGVNGYQIMGDESFYLSPNQIGTDNDWVTAAAGFYNVAAIKSDGTLWSWGYNLNGEGGDGTTSNTTEPAQIGTDTWLAVTKGELHTIAIKSDGTLWGWGNNVFGQIGNSAGAILLVPTQIGTSSDWLMISASGYSTLAIKNDGTLWAWGSNQFGQAGIGTPSGNIMSPVQVGTNSDWAYAITSGDKSIAIKQNGTLYGWGQNTHGELGDGTTTIRHAPVQIGTATNWKVVSTAFWHTVAVKTDGTLWSWGSNDQRGFLGNGSWQNTLVLAPTQIGQGTEWDTCRATSGGGLAKSIDGGLFGWGYNETGNAGDGSGTDVNVPTGISCTGLGTAESVSNDIIIYPNPALNTIYFKRSIAFDGFAIIDFKGSITMSATGDFDNIDISILPAGIYMLAVNSAEGRFIKRFTKL